MFKVNECQERTTLKIASGLSWSLSVPNLIKHSNHARFSWKNFHVVTYLPHVELWNLQPFKS